jgi:Ca2+-binding RTX toxin-like protein
VSNAPTLSYADAIDAGHGDARFDNGIAGTDTLSALAADNRSGVRGAELIDQTMNADGTYSFSGNDNIDAVLIGSRWTSSTLTFTFTTDGSYDRTNGYGSALIPFNAAQQEATRAAFTLVEGYTLLTIKEVAPDAEQAPTFRLAQTKSLSLGSAQGSFPDFINGEGGQIWFGRTQQPYYETPAKGNWGYATILHEIGHTLGLKHGMDDYTNVNIGEILGDGSTRFGSVAIEYDKDGQAWSLMTYTSAPNTISSFEGEGANQPQSYMQLDIAALQYLYGANYTTNAGDTVYRWNAATGEGFINGVGQGAPTANTVFETIWDGGGVDTYDFSNYGGGMTVDLRPGAFSLFSTDQLANNDAFTGGNTFAPGNIANALLHDGNVASLIENANGGTGSDTLIGNQVDNVLRGNAGDDWLAAGTGSDTLDGGAGADVADFAGATAGITVTIDPKATIAVANGRDVDTLVGIEGVSGTAFDDTLTGNRGANYLGGGTGGHDVLTGNGGDDRLVGGGYTLAWRDEPDVVRTADTLNKSLAAAIVLDGAFDHVAHAGVSTSVEYPGASLPHAVVVAEGSSATGNDYYRFDAVAGARALFDIDATNNYTGIEVLDAAGTVLAANYGELTTDAGSRQGYDARLDYTFQADGTYYIRVTGSTYLQTPWVLPAGQPYTLNVSLEHAATAAPELRDTASGDFSGGDGADTIVATAGDDRIDGGRGRDTLSYANHYQGVSVALGVAGVQATGAGADTIVGIEKLIGTTYADRLTGSEGNNVIDGGDGSDTLAGGTGRDTLSFASQATGVAVSLALQGVAQTYRLGETVLATGFEDLTGTLSADVLTGDAAANRLRGLAGSDLLAIGALNADGSIDRLFGGRGVDTASFAALGMDVDASLRARGGGQASVGGAQIAALSHIEALTGGAGSDHLVGSLRANTLTGGAGDDVLLGGKGSDVLAGGAGGDLLLGGEGRDLATFDGTASVRVDLAITGRQDTGAGNDRLLGIEDLRGGSGDDVLFGNASDNTFYDTLGSDSYDGRGGRDTVSYAGRLDQIELDLGVTAAQPIGAEADTLVGIENVVGGDGGNFLTGTVAANRLEGGAAEDILVGGAGRDTLIGGDGDDFLTGDGFALEPAGTRTLGDVLVGGAGSDTLFGDGGDDTISGGDGDDFVSNGTFASSVDGTGWTRGLLIRADGGNDVIDGGAGVDFGVLAYNGRQEGVTVDVRDPSATTAIISGGVVAGSITGIETLGFEGGEGDDVVYSGAGYDFLAGNGGDDTILAGAGDDVVSYSSGNDTLDGGFGFDAINLENAEHGVRLDLRATSATSGGDTLAVTGFETAISSRFGDTIHLLGWDDSIFDAGVGNDRFFGAGGNDGLTIVRSNATASTNLLSGGAGDDRLTYYGEHMVDGAATRLDTVRVAGGGGEDYIIASGAKFATVSGGGGNDFIQVDIFGATAQGRSVLTLGSGRDTIALIPDEATLQRDHSRTVVTDFAVAEDRIDITELTSGVYDDQGGLHPLLVGLALGEDPFGGGYLKLVQSGADTLVTADADAGGSAYDPVTVLVLKDVDATTLTGSNFQILPFELGVNVATQPQVSFGEHLVGTDAGETLNGGRLGDGLVGLGGDDVLHGRNGDDSLLSGDGSDLLDGGRGADVMNGGRGDDSYVVDSAGDRITELFDGGTDTVRTTSDFDMTNMFYVENLQVVGAQAVDVTGNFSDNLMRAGAGGGTLDGFYGNDTLVGSTGMDLLIGFDGNDILSGGGSADDFAFDTRVATGADRILDFGSDDQLLVTVALAGPDGDGVIALDAGLLTLASGSTVQIDGAAGLRLDGTVVRDGVTYTAYALSGPAGQDAPTPAAGTQPVPAAAFGGGADTSDVAGAMAGLHGSDVWHWSGTGHIQLV